MTADPLDAFMATNRKKARQQAAERLSTKRDALREEQARLKLMMEAARPSMPELKATAKAPTAPPPTEASKCVTKYGIDSNVPGSTPQNTDEAASASASNSAPPDEQRSPIGMAPPAVIGTPPGRRAGHGTEMGRGVGTVSEPDERRPGSSLTPRPARGGAMRPPPAAVAALLSRPSAASLPRPSASGERRKTEDGKVGETSVVSSDENGGGDTRRGQHNSSKEPLLPEQAVEGKSAGVKRRGTPVGGAEMQPPPPTKRPQQRENPSTIKGAAGQEQQPVPASTSTKRAVKGPAAMPPPVGKTPPGPGIKSAVGAGKSDGVKVAGKGGVLEGGDADWVPPKGQAGDGRTALNLKFGY